MGFFETPFTGSSLLRERTAEFTDGQYRVAELAYDAYVKQAGGVSLATGDKLPAFDGLKQSIKDSWAAAGIAVRLDREKEIPTFEP